MDQKDAMGETREQFVEEALARYEGPLIGYAMGIVHDVERARDVVQDTFIRLYQQDRDQVGRGLKAWLYTVCRNRALDILRKEKRLVLVKDKELFSEKENSISPDHTADWDERVSLVMISS